MPAGRRLISPRAKEDLKSIEAYIAEHDGEARADKVIERIDKTIDALAFMPGIGSRRSYLEPEDRAFAVAPWTIFYRPLADGIRVLRIIDGRRDLAALFGKKKR
jgi:toxin ParE1/3/4